MVMRILLLLSLSWIMGLTKPLFTVPLVGGGDQRPRPRADRGRASSSSRRARTRSTTGSKGHEGEKSARVAASYGAVLAQIMALDIVFSLDSVITAVGMVQQVGVMIAAVVAAVVVMMAFARPIGDYVARHPTIKMLALAFLLAIGVMLMADGFGHHVPKGYLYFAMAFSLGGRDAEPEGRPPRAAGPPAPAVRGGRGPRSHRRR